MKTITEMATELNPLTIIIIFTLPVKYYTTALTI